MCTQWCSRCRSLTPCWCHCGSSRFSSYPSTRSSTLHQIVSCGTWICFCSVILFVCLFSPSVVELLFVLIFSILHSLFSDCFFLFCSDLGGSFLQVKVHLLPSPYRCILSRCFFCNCVHYLFCFSAVTNVLFFCRRCRYHHGRKLCSLLSSPLSLCCTIILIINNKKQL